MKLPKDNKGSWRCACHLDFQACCRRRRRRRCCCCCCVSMHTFPDARKVSASLMAVDLSARSQPQCRLLTCLLLAACSLQLQSWPSQSNPGCTRKWEADSNLRFCPATAAGAPCCMECCWSRSLPQPGVWIMLTQPSTSQAMPAAGSGQRCCGAAWTMAGLHQAFPADAVVSLGCCWATASATMHSIESPFIPAKLAQLLQLATAA